MAKHIFIKSTADEMRWMFDKKECYEKMAIKNYEVINQKEYQASNWNHTTLIINYDCEVRGVDYDNYFKDGKTYTFENICSHFKWNFNRKDILKFGAEYEKRVNEEEKQQKIKNELAYKRQYEEKHPKKELIKVKISGANKEDIKKRLSRLYGVDVMRRSLTFGKNKTVCEIVMGVNKGILKDGGTYSIFDVEKKTDNLASIDEIQLKQTELVVILHAILKYGEALFDDNEREQVKSLLEKIIPKMRQTDKWGLKNGIKFMWEKIRNVEQTYNANEWGE